MRGIADQVATRLTRHGASAFTVANLGMICWAYSKLKVRQRLSTTTTIVAQLDNHVHAGPDSAKRLRCQQKCRR